jgi:hypothetical protein
VTGYLDLGELATADCWWHGAIVGWGTGCNFGGEFEQLFKGSNEIEPDRRRIASCRLLYDPFSRSPISRARAKTASNIGSVRTPVKVFCWLG